MSWSLNGDGASLHGSCESRLTWGDRTLLGRSAGAWGVGMTPGKCCHPFDSDFFTLSTIKFSSGS